MAQDLLKSFLVSCSFLCSSFIYPLRFRFPWSVPFFITVSSCIYWFPTHTLLFPEEVWIRGMNGERRWFSVHNWVLDCEKMEEKRPIIEYDLFTYSWWSSHLLCLQMHTSHILALLWVDMAGWLCALKTTHGYNQWLEMGTENWHVL